MYQSGYITVPVYPYSELLVQVDDGCDECLAAKKGDGSEVRAGSIGPVLPVHHSVHTLARSCVLGAPIVDTCNIDKLVIRTFLIKCNLQWSRAKARVGIFSK